jgi:acyl carrier protein
MQCFRSVFPSLTLEEIRVANAESSGVWDSLTGVTLAAVVQEEFGVEIDPVHLSELDSFEAYRHYLRGLDRQELRCHE